MKLKNLYIPFTLFLLVPIAIFVACKRSQVEAPEIQTNLSFVQPLSLSNKVVDFTVAGNTVRFQAKFNESTHWRITIIGENSYAIKAIEGISSVIDTTWDGSQDSLYYFRGGERCFITVGNVVDVDDNDVTKQLKTRGELQELPSILSRDTIQIAPANPNDPNNLCGLAKPKASNVIDLCPNTGIDYSYLYVAGYDDENSLHTTSNPPIYDTQVEMDKAIVTQLPGTWQSIFNFPLQYAKGGQAMRGPNYFMVKGHDTTQLCNKANYYIGRLATQPIAVKAITASKTNYSYVLYNNQLNLIKAMNAASADQVYINLFIYGTGDGSKLNLTVKEDDDKNSTYEDKKDEQYQAQITLSFTGWKLFSFNYASASFQYQAPPIGLGCNNIVNTPGQFSNRVKEPANIIQVQWSLVARDQGGPGQFIIDYPSITLGGPLTY